MPLSQSWIDPNTGATYPASYVVWRQNAVDPVNQIVDISTMRYASIASYSLGFQPLRTTGTQFTGQTYASWFAIPVGSANAVFRSTVEGAAASFLVGAPEYSGAAFTAVQASSVLF